LSKENKTSFKEVKPIKRSSNLPGSVISLILSFYKIRVFFHDGFQTISL